MRANIIATLFLTFCFTIGYTQESKNTTQTDSVEDKKIDFKVMPFINYNRNLDFMFGAVPMVMYKLDKNDQVSPKSLSGIAAAYTTNDSHLIAFFNRWFFKEDSWRAVFYAVTGNFNSQMFLDGGGGQDFYNFGTDATIISATLRRKLVNKLYGGVAYTFGNYKTEFENDVQPATTTRTHSLELNMLYDSRNAIYYPTGGVNSQLRFLSFPEWFGNEVSATKFFTEYNTYFSTRNENDVIAARVSGKFGLGDIAFEQQETIGGKDIRGYSQEKYRGDGILALQGEYRYNFSEKMGLVGFAGIATIYGSPVEDFDWKAYPGVGVGYRYAAFKNVKFNIGIDAAVGKDDWGIYFRLGEAF
ncbi:BamA/TamA family outer membrane protein [Tamlana sp. 2201CG12-4]|uniref:BamA/TamA family outer membrane protein n=1 Tax=Tamlana sp. 2201CG12-4 TaxID=3112582 RepID=UPI002DB57CFE|nr:BamA/TamA family outer membrane protein [Tamlana sp. 2201CG12-4]MEC3908766.1 BamA/TamA family outer membrane protein [Tamlana sp. 2201CG12-4]